jgi:OmpA-OmpF porin, OOP family
MRLSKPLFWLLTLFWFAASVWWYGSYSKCSGCSAALPAALVKTSLPGFAVSDSNWALSSEDNLRFAKSGSTPVFSTEVTKILDSLSVYAKNHPGKTITVTGHYKADERNNSSFDNLGLARADELKKWLVNKGLPDKNIITQSQLDDGLIFSPADTLVGGISLAFHNISLPVQESVKDDLFEPRTVYFNTGKNTLSINADLKNYLEKVKEYLQNHADKKLSVTGYTDNAGDAEKNMQLSARRAAFVKDELIKKGIEGAKIESSGKGMDEPVADNNTTEGKAKNRRVTIQLQ